MKILALILCDTFLSASIVEICRQSIEPVFNHLHFFIATYAHATQKLLPVCEQVKITLDPGLDCKENGKKCPR